MKQKAPSKKSPSAAIAQDDKHVTHKKKQEEVKINGREFVGKVVSTKMKDTIVVIIERFILHPLYKKPVRKTQKLSVHAPENNVIVGDTVKIQETKPISKTKHFILKSS